MRTHVSLALALVAAAAMPRLAAAQVCLAQPALGSGSVSAIADAQFDEGTSTYVGTLRFAGATVFGDIDAGVATFDDLDEKSWIAGASLGAQFAPVATSSVRVCPIAGAQFAFGPNDVDVLGTPVDFSARAFSAGLGVGGVALSTAQFELIPAIGAAYVHSTATVKALGEDESESEGYGLLRAGVGFSFQRMFTVTPHVSVPVGLDDSDATFGVSLGFRFGRQGT